ncbi:RNA-binding protein 28-like [Anneissia japonica]|uniref:RNA-binding protein 28-like n=2 Tax=Anneissia japonica TaxID=1529436 RepID=UPI00142569B4|nr:RNA-binding protein 28-like [Anneissia japonica]
MAARSEHSQNTLFVRNLPFFTTDDKFEGLFGDIGPLKRCFLVRDRGVKDKCRGFGYVTFASREDAVKAIHANKSLNGRKLVVKFADRKSVKKVNELKKGKKVTEEGESEDEEENENIHKDIKEREPKDITSITTRRTLVIKNLPKKATKEDVVEIASQTANVEEVKFPVTEEEENLAYIRYQSPSDAKTAQPLLKKVKSNGGNLVVILLAFYKPTVSQTSLKKGRLIIRNLAFKCRENDLRKAFEKFGEISEVSIPRKGSGDNDRIIGFGFVQFVKVKAAEKAVKEMNAKEILGRKVAVDWSLPKQKYDAIKGNTSSKSTDINTEESDEEDNEGTDSGGSNQDVEESEEDEEEEDNEVDTDDDEVDMDEEEEEGSDDNDEASDEEINSSNKQKFSKSGNKSTFQRKSDVSAGKTVFVRNIPFDINSEDLQEFFEDYGEVNYCRLVVDPNTERLRGSAFVQFTSQDYAEECIATSETESGIVFKNRRLQLNLALSREEATKLRTQEKDKEKVKNKDKRNLYLLREGMIRPGTQAAEGLSEAEIRKRTNLEKIKRIKLKNLNVFVSPMRLAVHNLPVSVDNAKLRNICVKAIGQQKNTITEARIMRDLSRKNSSGVCKSLGYGFVSANNHENALKLLNYLNNNSEIFGPKKRPIVGFSLENRSALELKEKRRQKSKSISMEKIKKNVDDVKHNPSSAKKQKANTAVTRNLEDSTFVERKLQAKKQGLPKHFGPKERWRDRGKQVNKKKIKQLSGSKLEKPTNLEEKQNKKKKVKKPSSSRRNKGKDEDKNFNKLVESYKKKISDVTRERKVTSKWFE